MSPNDIKSNHSSKCNGFDLIESAALFEAGAAAVIAAEGQLIRKLIKRKESENKLISVNRQVANILCCLKDLEEEILAMIN